jgi:hypothetical protein
MCLVPHLHLRTETDPVSETSYSLEYQTMGKVKKPSNSVCYTPSLEPFRIYLYNCGFEIYHWRGLTFFFCLDPSSGTMRIGRLGIVRESRYEGEEYALVEDKYSRVIQARFMQCCGQFSVIYLHLSITSLVFVIPPILTLLSQY